MVEPIVTEQDSNIQYTNMTQRQGAAGKDLTPQQIQFTNQMENSSMMAASTEQPSDFVTSRLPKLQNSSQVMQDYT